MAIVTTDDKHYYAISDRIRFLTDTTETYKPSEMPQGVQDVYDVAYEKGKKSQYDEFWDAFQRNGTRTTYEYSFAGDGWNTEIFKPKHTPMNCTNCNYMFHGFDRTLKKPSLVIDENIIDFTNVTNASQVFRDANVREIIMNAIPLKSPSMSGFCQMTNLNWHPLKKLKLGVHESMAYDRYSFWSMNVTDISFLEGSVIGKSIYFGKCTLLTHESLLNILNTLQEKTSGTFTCTLGTTNLEKLTDEEKAIATEKGWTLA